MRPFLSLPWKFMLVLLTLMTILGVGLTWAWIAKTNQDFLRKQQEFQQQNQQQYQLLNDLLLSRLESWMESMVQLQNTDNDHLDAIVKGIQGQLGYLQLNWQVTDVWVYENDGELVYRSATKTPPHITQGVKRVNQQQRSSAVINCADECVQSLFMPVLTNQGDVIVIAVGTTLLDTLAFLNQSSHAQLALVKHENGDILESANTFKLHGTIAKSQRAHIEHLIQSFPDHVTPQTLLQTGFRLQSNGAQYLINLIPMQDIDDGLNYILLAHDISVLAADHAVYQKKVIWLAILIFVINGGFFYLMANKFRTRLLLLANRLPLLAKRQFDVFGSSFVSQSRWFNDELDTLQSSATELAAHLQTLDLQVRSHTEELEQIAMFDMLTKLPNRNMLNYHLVEALAELDRYKGYVVLMFLDLDDFKKVNDSYGHNAGDKLLKEAAARLMSILRQSDLACRFGGDEFVVLLKHVDQISGALNVADKILKRFRDPVIVEDLRFYVSTSIGIAVTDSNKYVADDLIRHADIAMYAAKEAGGSCYEIYDNEMSHSALQKVALESEAREALIKGQFSFALQPQIRLSDGQLVGFEALIRWQHPQRGNIPPGEFIPVIESSEFFIAVGYWVIEHAFSILQILSDQGYPELKIAVNLGASQFLDPQLTSFLEKKLFETGFEASMMELELTERTLMSNIDSALAAMEELKHMGFSISIDDFGTGYSSLSYLKSMPSDIIKIDRSFINGMLTSDADKQIVLSTISMVQNLGMEVVAEGIETKEQADLLTEFNCDFVQGYYIARPIPEEKLINELERCYRDKRWHYPEVG